MGAALFYHMVQMPADTLVPRLIGKALADGWRVELRGADAARLARMDDLLWAGDGFVPHGRAGGPHDARQPVLLTLAGEAAGNTPDCLVALDGAEVAPAECTALQRVWIPFDGSDAPALERARAQWRTLTAAGIAAEYWSDADGGWTRKAQSPAKG